MDLVDVWFFVTAWTEACQAPLSVDFSRQECWRGLPCPPPGDLHELGIEPWVSCITGRLFTIWGTLDYLTGPSPRIPTNRMFHNWVKKGCDSRCRREALWKALDPPRLALKTEEGALSKGRQVSSRSWKTQGNILPGPSRRSSALLTPWFLAEGDSDWTSGLQNCKIRSLSCFRHQFVITCHSISGK